nr:MAG TPA: hypothetical protein [Caudoviricetes sp.]
MRLSRFLRLAAKFIFMEGPLRGGSSYHFYFLKRRKHNV